MDDNQKSFKKIEESHENLHHEEQDYEDRSVQLEEEE
jgi:hypothetical protein